MAEVDRMSESQCRALLAAGIVGRVGISTADGPVVLPLNYAVVHEAVVVATTAGSTVGRLAEDELVAFEVDHLDHDYHRGWSVLARGRVHHLRDPEEVELVRRTWEPRPWAAGPRTHWVSVRSLSLTGVRLGSGWTHADEVPVRRTLHAP